MTAARPALKRTFVCPLLQHAITRGVQSATKRPTLPAKKAAAAPPATPAATKSLTSLRGTSAPAAEPPADKPPIE